MEYSGESHFLFPQGTAVNLRRLLFVSLSILNVKFGCRKALVLLETLS
jgi:hypothetical protein